MGIDQYGIIGGVDSMMSARFTPWHGLSDMKVRVEERVTDVDRAFTLAGIDWTVSEHLLSEFVTLGLANEHKLVVRDDTQDILGIGSSRYGLIQNDVLKHLVGPVLQFRPDAHIESAGALFKGKVIWCLVRLDEETKVFGKGGDERQFRYMLFYTSHDGSKPLAVRFTNVRVECMNTFSMTMGKASQLVQTIRHTTNAESYAIAAQDALRAAVEQFDLLDLEIENLLSIEMSKSDTFTTFKRVLGDRPDSGRSLTMWDKAFDGIVEEWNADFNSNIRGTAWGTVMAVNGYELWGQTARGQSTAQKQMRHLLDGRYDLTAKTLTLVTA